MGRGSNLRSVIHVVALKKKHPGQTAFDTLSDSINATSLHFEQESLSFAKNVSIPVCYSEKFALDHSVFKRKGIALKQLAELHMSKTYRVFMLGFLPGFPYMAEVDEKLVASRKEVPRAHVAAGSVGIAGKQTGIYPLNSPGGWQIIGRTPWKLFNRQRAEPVLLQPGDNVTFYSISEDEFENYQGGPS